MRFNLRSGNWKRVRSYCDRCRTWTDDVTHKGCPKSGWLRGKPGNMWVEIVGMWFGCDKCHEVWKAEDNIATCECGHTRETRYSDSALVIGKTDRIIATDGELVHVLTRTGTVVVGRREYHGIGYR